MIEKCLIVGFDYQRNSEGTVIRSLAIGMRTLTGRIHVLRTVTSVLPEWPSGCGVEE